MYTNKEKMLIIKIAPGKPSNKHLNNTLKIKGTEFPELQLLKMINRPSFMVFFCFFDTFKVIASLIYEIFNYLFLFNLFKNYLFDFLAPFFQ